MRSDISRNTSSRTPTITSRRAEWYWSFFVYRFWSPVWLLIYSSMTMLGMAMIMRNNSRLIHAKLLSRHRRTAQQAVKAVVSSRTSPCSRNVSKFCCLSGRRHSSTRDDLHSYSLCYRACFFTHATYWGIINCSCRAIQAVATQRRKTIRQMIATRTCHSSIVNCYNTSPTIRPSWHWSPWPTSSYQCQNTVLSYIYGMVSHRSRCDSQLGGPFWNFRYGIARWIAFGLRILEVVECVDESGNNEWAYGVFFLSCWKPSAVLLYGREREAWWVKVMCIYVKLMSNKIFSNSITFTFSYKIFLYLCKLISYYVISRLLIFISYMLRVSVYIICPPPSLLVFALSCDRRPTSTNYVNATKG